MEGFRIFFHENIIKIIATIVAIIMILALIYVLNGYYKNKKNNPEETQTAEYGRDYAILTDTQKNEAVYTKETNIMQQFVDYCNAKDYENAYNLLTDDCKEVLYPNINIFIENYCNPNFATPKTCNFQAWNTFTYLVEIRNDAITSGEYTNTEYVRDYYTISTDGKLSINSYIKRKNIDNELTFYDNVKVKVDYVDYFIDYTQVCATITNPSPRAVIIDSKVEEKGIALVDENNLEYTSNINEIDREDLIVKQDEIRQLKLQYQVGYREDRDFTKLVFKNFYIERAGIQNNVVIDLF